MELYLPVFFEQATLGNIRKVFKLLRDHAWENDDAHETLDRFFPEWEQTLKDRLAQCEIDLKAAKQDAEDKRRIVSALGSTLDEQIEQAKRWLAHAKKRAKKRPEEVSEYTAALKKAEKPKTDHLQAVKEVKRAEQYLKTTKAAVERCGVIITAYKAIKAQNN